MAPIDGREESWPALPLCEWRETYETLHRWLQVIGKVRLALSPMVNHWWGATLYVTARGLTTSPMPCRGRLLEIDLDFLEHDLAFRVNDGRTRHLGLVPRTVARFFVEVRSILDELGLRVPLNPAPQEIPGAISLDEDQAHSAYDPYWANRWWRVLAQADAALKEFRARFHGKCSPVHFFWGSFDLAVTRFSGRPAAPRTRADAVTREAYSDECSSAGFWPGGGAVDDAAFYSYFAPAPAGFAEATIRPAAAYFDRTLNEFVLPYEAVRTAPSPAEALLDFFQSTYAAGADLAGWDRERLERAPEFVPPTHLAERSEEAQPAG